MLEIHVPRFEPVRRKLIAHPTLGRGQLLSPEGDVLWEDPDWIENTLADEGEKSILDVYFREQAHPAKWLFLLNDSSLAETDTMAGVTEAKVPGVDGYARQQILAGDWSVPALDTGDMQSTASEKVFGPATGNAWTLTHAALTTAQTGTGGLFVLYVALSATTVVAIGQSFKYTLKSKVQ